MYILDDENNVMPVDDITYLKWRQENEMRHLVARSQVNENTKVSTVFLFDNFSFNPNFSQFFETIVFQDGDEVDGKRYATYQGALEGHKLLEFKYKLIDRNLV